MAFEDRFRPDPTDGNTRTISFHELSAGMRKLTNHEWTIQVYMDRFNLDETDHPGVIRMVAFYQKMTPAKRELHYGLLESEGMLWETGRISESEFKKNTGLF